MNGQLSTGHNLKNLATIVYVGIMILSLGFSGIELYKLKTTLKVNVFQQVDVLPDKDIQEVLHTLHL